MTPQQEEHLRIIKSAFSFLVDRKYRKGQEEHGGDLFDKTTDELLDSAIDEAIDQVVYLLTARERLIKERNEFEKKIIIAKGLST